MELLDYLQVLRRHTMMIALLCVSATLGAIFYSMVLLTDQYKATALVLVTPHENIKVSTTKSDKEVLNFPVSGQAKVETPSNTYIELITGRATAEKVVNMLHMDRQDPKQAPTTLFGWVKGFFKDLYDQVMIATIQILKYGRILPPLSPFERAVERFQKNISLKAIKDSYVFELSYTSANPVHSADVANAAATVFLEQMTATRVNTAKAVTKFVGERLAGAEKTLAVTRLALRAFQEKHKIASLKDETTEKIKALSELQVALAKAEVKVDGLLKTLTRENPKVQAAEAEKFRLISVLKAGKAELSVLPEQQKQQAELSLDLLAAEDIYQLVRKEYEESSIREGMHVAEMTVASPAFPPAYPSKPIKAYYVGGALAGALLLGIGLAFLLEYLNTTIRTVDDAERVLQLRVLATVPSTKLGG